MGSLSETDVDTMSVDDTAQVDTKRIRLASRARDMRPVGLSARQAAQATIGASIACVGKGLHTGVDIRLSLHPAPAGHGIVFQRTDLDDAEPIAARYDRVIDTRLSTVIGLPDDRLCRVATVEHLMAALSARGIDNVLVMLSGPEVPVLDGSSAEFDFLLQCVGRTEQTEIRAPIEILRRVRVEGPNGAFAELRPRREGLSLTMTIDFAAAAIGRQSFSTTLTQTLFREHIACCRTFVERSDIEALWQAGLARGGSLDNAIVVDGDTVLNPGGLRHPDEFARHKLLDAIGDLALAGAPLQANFTGYKSGHDLNNRLLRAVFADRANWRMAGVATPDRVAVAA